MDDARKMRRKEEAAGGGGGGGGGMKVRPIYRALVVGQRMTFPGVLRSSMFVLCVCLSRVSLTTLMRILCV